MTSSGTASQMRNCFSDYYINHWLFRELFLRWLTQSIFKLLAKSIYKILAKSFYKLLSKPINLSPHASRIRGNEQNCTGNCNPRFIQFSIFPQKFKPKISPNPHTCACMRTAHTLRTPYLLRIMRTTRSMRITWFFQKIYPFIHFCLIIRLIVGLNN